MSGKELCSVIFFCVKRVVLPYMGSYSFKHIDFISTGFSVGKCDEVVSDRLPWAYIWSFQLLPLRFTERRSEGLRLAGGDAKHTNERVVFHSFLFFPFFYFFFFSSFPPPPSLLLASNSLACTNPHLLYPRLQKMALRSKPVQLIHIEASRCWIIGIKTALPTSVGHEQAPRCARSRTKGDSRIGESGAAQLRGFLPRSI